MKKSSIYIERLEDVPAEALEALKKEWEMNEDFEDFDELLEGIREGYEDYEESADSCYITKTYYLTVGDWKFEIEGSSYRKDQCICDEQLDDGFTLTSLKKLKEENKSKNKSERAKSDKQWRNLLSKFPGTMEPEDAFNLLREYKFPNKWKS